MRARRLSNDADADGARAARFSRRALRTLRCQQAPTELKVRASASEAPAAALQGCQVADQLQRASDVPVQRVAQRDKAAQGHDRPLHAPVVGPTRRLAARASRKAAGEVAQGSRVQK